MAADGPCEALGEIWEHHRAPGTIAQYVAMFQRVKQWAQRQRVSVLPMNPTHFARYLVTLANYCKTRKLLWSNILSACTAVRYMH